MNELFSFECHYWADGSWRSVPVLCHEPPPPDGEEKLKKWWKAEVKRLRAAYNLTANVLIIVPPER